MGPLGRCGLLMNRLKSLLTADELARANRFHFDEDRRAFVAIRSTLRILLALYVSIPPNDLRFIYNCKGKPSLTDDHPIRFNVSHSGAMALLAFALGQELGVDIERIRGMRDMTGIARGFFCPEESADLASVPPPDRARAFFLCWTRKEAYIKAIGEGFSTPLDSFRVTLRPTEPARFLHTWQQSGAAKRWKLHNIEVNEHYAAALAYEGKSRAVALRPLMNEADVVSFL